MSNSPGQTILCQEIFDESSQPSEKEIIDYAVKIGIDPKTEPHLLPIAKDGLMQALPDGWKPCYDASVDGYYYFNAKSGVSQWEHPLDSKYKEKVRRGRSEGYSSAASLIATGEDDSKTTAKEDLRSFEEVSDMLSSRSFDSKLMRRNQHSALLSVGGEEGGGLLARRKQNQRLEDDMAAATAVVTASANNPIITTKTLLNNNQTGSRVTGGIDEALRLAKQRLTPMRRSQTLEEVLPRRDDVWQEDTWQEELPNASKWISDKPQPRRQSEVLQKRPVGILRDSPSDPHPPPRRLAPIQGPFGWNEGEDERKRSVRFADLERKSLDIKFDLSVAPTSQSSASNSEEEVVIETDSSDGENNERKLLDGRGKFSESKSSIDSEKTVESSNSGSGEKTRRGVDSAKSMETSSDSVHKKSAETSSESVHHLQKSSESSSDSKASSSSYSKLKYTETPIQLPPDPENKERLIKREVSFDDTILTKIEVKHRKMATDKIAALEKQLAETLEQKIAALNEEMNSTLQSAKVSIRKKETNEILKIRSEYEKRIKEFKETLAHEAKEKEENLRLEKEAEEKELLTKLEEEKNQKLISVKEEMDQEIERVKISYKESLSAQSETNQSLIEQTRTSSDLRLSEELKAIKAKEETEISRLEAECENAVREAKLKFENRIREIELNHEREIEKLVEEHSRNLERLKLEKEGEARRVEAEWQDRITATASQHKDILESAIAQHDVRLHQLRSQFNKEEEELKKKHSEQLEAWNIRVQKMADKEQSHLSHINREFEKMRCEKRLLEDKYRSLKDKYIQMKTEMRMAIERRLQKKKKLQSSQNDSGKVEINVEGCSYEKSVDNDQRHQHSPSNNNGCYLEVPQNDDGQLSSADELLTSTSITYPSHSRSLRKEEDPCRGGCRVPRSPLSGNRSPIGGPKSPLLTAKTPVGAPKSPILGATKARLENPKSPAGGAAIILDNLKSQLVELDYLGEPSTALPDTYLRYPFTGEDGRSAEVDFYRHRLVVEEEAVRQARQCLEQQARELQARHALLANQPSNTLQQLQQQERDLTEMEVSLHRTKALLGEKMIRLRLLGHTLASLNPQGGGGGGGDHNNWKTYDNINAEIQEIWAALDKVTSLSVANPTTQFDFSKLTRVGESSRGREVGTPSSSRFAAPPAVTPASPSSNANRAEVEAKLASIKEWLHVTSKRASLSL